MKRQEFYEDEICCEVARVYCRRRKGRRPVTVASQCDALIKHVGSVQAAYEYAYDYLAGGCGIVG